MEYGSTFLVTFSSGDVNYSFRATTVSIHTQPNGAIIQAIETGRDKGTSYWTAWGGWCEDLPESTFFIMYNGDVFLTQVETLQDLLLFQNSYWVNGTQVFIHTPGYIWQEEDLLTRFETLIGFSTNIPDQSNPSSDKIGGVRYPVRMRVPSLPLQLSEPVFGVNLAPTFTIQLDNHDGLFDSHDSSSILNSPLSVYRSTAQPATVDTFRKIRSGEIENIRLDMTSFTIQVADTLRTLEDPLCRTVSEAGLGGDNSMDLPVVYGVAAIDLIQLESSDTKITYIACDPLYFKDIKSVTDSDGKTVSGDWSHDTSGIITYTLPVDGEADRAYGEPAWCVVKGLSADGVSKLGWAVKNEVTNKTRIVYTNTFWNIDEFEDYADSSPVLNVAVSGGSVKDFISAVLKSASSFFIQQNDGRLTIRKWTNQYVQHEFGGWVHTQKPSKKFSDYKNYCSSLIVKYKDSNGASHQYLRNAEESVIIATWRKNVRATFETNLQSSTQAELFSEELIGRFGNRAQIWDIAIGKDSSAIELLDSITIPIVINGRVLSNKTKWKVTGLDPAQDMLTVEEDTFVYDPGVNDGSSGPMSHPFNSDDNGYMSQLSVSKKSGILSKSTINK